MRFSVAGQKKEWNKRRVNLNSKSRHSDNTSRQTVAPRPRRASLAWDRATVLEPLAAV